MKFKLLPLFLAFSLPVQADVIIQPNVNTVTHSHGVSHAYDFYTPVLTRNGFNGTYVSFHGHIHRNTEQQPTVHQHLGHQSKHSHKALPHRS